MAKIWLSVLSRLFGLRESRRSLLGKHAQKFINYRRTQRVLSVFLLALTSGIFLIRSFSNVGGPLALNPAVLAAPSVAIDPLTIPSVQKPINYFYESRGYSLFHSGADLVAPVGTPVHPVMEGLVEAVNYDAFGFGKHVIVSHAEGYESIYGHLDQIEVKQGQKVGLNTELGKSGSTGFSTGPHLHLEIHQNGSAVNPAEIVPGVN